MNAALRNPNLDLQFSISSMLCTTGTFAVLLTYLRAFAHNDFLLGLKVVGLIALLAVAVGCWWERIFETTLWSSLGAMTAFLCAVGEPLAHNTFNYAWPLVGAATATSAILSEGKPLWRRMAVGAGLALAILGSFSIAAWSQGIANTWPEVACGPLAGAIMVGVVLAAGDRSNLARLFKSYHDFLTNAWCRWREHFGTLDRVALTPIPLRNSNK